MTNPSKPKQPRKPRSPNKPPADPAADPTRQLLSAKYVANQLAISEALVYALARADKLTHTKVGTLVRFRQADVDAFLATSSAERGTKCD
jgi:excisionase family DNA binding protein